MLTVLVFMVIVVVLAVLLFVRARTNKKLSLQLKSLSAAGNSMRAKESDYLETGPNTYDILQTYNIEYDYSKLKLMEEIGEGHFGVVYKGRAPGIHRGSYTPGEYVAIKTLKSGSVHYDNLEEFIKEVKVSIQFDHDNVIRLLGICTRSPQKCMIFEYMDLGSLNELLRQSDPALPHSLGDHRSKGPITPDLLLGCVLQVAWGLKYFADLNFVHRDIATRNCLVNREFVVKIGDFGMSRAIDSTSYYQIGSGKTFLPVRWMPPEAILHGKFTLKSDVWSFGVLMWEIYTFGHQPYAGISNYEVVNEVKNRRILERPNLCPPAIYDVMTSCWTHASSKRPNMSEIVERLQSAEGGADELDDEYISMAPVTTVKYSELLAREDEEQQELEKADTSKDDEK